MMRGQESARKAGISTSAISGLERRHQSTHIEPIAKFAVALHIVQVHLRDTWPHGMKQVED